jgi:MFS family permease
MSNLNHTDWTHLDTLKDILWNLVMLLYLLTGLALAPLVLGEILVALGWMQSMNEQTMPSWMYGYVVLTMFVVALGQMIAWLPALLICILFWNRWRAVAPALSIILFAACLFFLPDGRVNSTLLNFAAVSYVVFASGVGIEWLIRRKLSASKVDHEAEGS